MYKPQDTRWIACRNDNSGTAPAYGAVRITGSATVDGTTVLTFDQPNSDATQIIAALWPFDIPSGEYGYCTFISPMLILTDSSTVTYGDSWTIENGEWTVTDDAGDFIAVAESNILDVAVFLSDISGNRMHWGKLDAQLDYDDTTGVTVSIWAGDTLADTGLNVANVLPPPTMESGSIDSGDYVLITRLNNNWYVTLAPC